MEYVLGFVAAFGLFIYVVLAVHVYHRTKRK